VLFAAIPKGHSAKARDGEAPFIHIGVDAESGLVHSVIGTSANVADITQAGALLHGKEEDAFGDAAYRGVQKRKDAQGPRWHVAMQPGKRRKLDLTRPWARLLEQAKQLKASVRAKVEHPFHVMKNLFRHKKVRYKGLAKNQAQLFSLFGLANLVIAKRRLLAPDARGAS
jgi:IS5 family transposase